MSSKNLIVASNVLLFPQHRRLRTHHYKLPIAIAHCPTSLTFMVSIHRYRKFTYATLKGPRASLVKIVLKQATRRNSLDFATLNFDNVGSEPMREKREIRRLDREYRGFKSFKPSFIVRRRYHLLDKNQVNFTNARHMRTCLTTLPKKQPGEVWLSLELRTGTILEAMCYNALAESYC